MGKTGGLLAQAQRAPATPKKRRHMSHLVITRTVLARRVPERLDGTGRQAWFAPSSSSEAGTSPLAEASGLLGGSR